eukprot:scaffold113801_cov27-Prasinocladus_malaysianus.AAC.3
MMTSGNITAAATYTPYLQPACDECHFIRRLVKLEHLTSTTKQSRVRMAGSMRHVCSRGGRR